MVSKNLAKQPFINRKDATKFIFTMLKLRQQINRNCNGGMKYKTLSRPASKRLLRCNSKVMPKLRRFWERFDVRHSRRVRLKRRGSKSLKRAAACSEKAAKEHIGELAEELIARGTMEDAVKVESGVWTGRIDARRIMNNDETPQFIDYDVDGSANNLYYAGTGDECAAAISENRECVTIHPMINMEGDVMSCHAIFAAAGITSHMAPDEAVDKIENLLISTTEHGMGSQTGKSLLRFYQELDKDLTRRQVKRTVVVLTDGHSSRFDLEVLKFCHEKDIYIYTSLYHHLTRLAFSSLLTKSIHYSIEPTLRARRTCLLDGTLTERPSCACLESFGPLG